MSDDRSRGGETGQDYHRLPRAVPLTDVIASVEPDPAPDPEAGRNPDQHRALRDD